LAITGLKVRVKGTMPAMFGFAEVNVHADALMYVAR
jgi:hypothetical protein